MFSCFFLFSFSGFFLSFYPSLCLLLFCSLFFKKRFLIIPINESLHWSVAIVCNLDKYMYHLSDSDDPSGNARKLTIIHLDSLGTHKSTTVRTHINYYLYYMMESRYAMT